MNKKGDQTGFSLVEVTIVLAIIGVLVGSGFGTLGSFTDNAKQNHTKGSLETTKAAVLNYVKVNRHAPCPDSDDDGNQNRTGNKCDVYLGTVPFNDLGLPRGTAADDWGNVFGYGVHQQANNATTMALNAADTSAGGGAELLAASAGSYFYSSIAPAFTLDTPPTFQNSDSSTESYTVCKRTAADDCSGANDKEMEFLPIVIVAFNENGGLTDINACNSAAYGTRETQNCDANMQFIKGVFSKSVFDDQIATISAYEIKQQVLDAIKPFDPTSAFNLPAGFDYIVNKNMINANEVNIATSGTDTLYIAGDSHANFNTSGGDDVVTIMGKIYAKVDGKADNDTLYVSMLPTGYPPASSSLADIEAKLNEVMADPNVLNFEQVCYFEEKTLCVP
jgi:prepilin-type N-terminal cleavage/methylation domain-containing protein